MENKVYFLIHLQEKLSSLYLMLTERQQCIPADLQYIILHT